MELFNLPDLPSEPLLACGGDDGRVNLFVRQEGKVSTGTSTNVNFPFTFTDLSVCPGDESSGA